MVKSRVKESGTQIDQKINQIRKEVHAALLADRTLGLGFVYDIEPGVASEPELSEGDKPAAEQILIYTVKYRTSETDLSA